MKIWVVEYRVQRRYTPDSPWRVWHESPHYARSDAREACVGLRMLWPAREFRVRAYQRIEASR